SPPKGVVNGGKDKSSRQASGSFEELEAGMSQVGRDAKPITVRKIDGTRPDDGQGDVSSGIYVLHTVARLDKDVANRQSRPVLALAWELEFTLTLLPNKEVQEQQLLNVFTEGLIAIGLGTWRGRFGKAEVIGWE